MERISIAFIWGITVLMFVSIVNVAKAEYAPKPLVFVPPKCQQVLVCDYNGMRCRWQTVCTK